MSTMAASAVPSSVSVLALHLHPSLLPVLSSALTMARDGGVNGRVLLLVRRESMEEAGVAEALEEWEGGDLERVDVKYVEGAEDVRRFAAAAHMAEARYGTILVDRLAETVARGQPAGTTAQARDLALAKAVALLRNAAAFHGARLVVGHAVPDGGRLDSTDAALTLSCGAHLRLDADPPRWDCVETTL